MVEGVARGGVVFALSLVLAACQRQPTTPEAQVTPAPVAASPGSDMMGGMALGGSATTEVLASVKVGNLPNTPLVWVAHESTLPSTGSVTHRHALGFAYAAEGTHCVIVEGLATRLQMGQATFVGNQMEHTHAGPGRFWEIRLTAPNTGPPPGLSDARLVFRSPLLASVPHPPVQLNFILVKLSPGGETSVHSHPGPEYIYVTKGPIVYQNALVGTRRMQTGDDHALPPDTAVQKRNPGTETTAFLSWFAVDPQKPFAPKAVFQSGAAARRPGGRNVASIKSGARVIGVSSNHGGESNSSQYGANNALDGDGTTEWSSNSDGNKAWIEIDLAKPFDITAIGLWTRTMGSSAQIVQFEVVADGRTRLGPFTLPDAAGTHYFPVKVTARRLRFNVLKSSGGNTGAVEIEALTTP